MGLSTSQRLLDAGTAVWLAGVAVAELWVPFSSVQGEGDRGLTTVVVVIGCLALALRRVAPLAAAVLVLALWPVSYSVQPLLVVFWGGFVPMVVVVFSVARHGRGRQPLYGALAGAGTLLFLDLRVDVLQTPGEFVFHWLVMALAWSLGRGLQVAEQRAADSLRRAVEAEVAGAERTMAALVEERSRIARELHDVVAHAVSVMVVQAGAAEQVVDVDTDHVRSALHTIRTTGADALAEMRRVVEMLRDADELGALAPQPGIGQLCLLVDEARGGGLTVSLTVAGRVRDLPAGLDLTAYRIVQEALTNVRRHAGAAHARVDVRFLHDAVELAVEDDGAGVPAGGAEGSADESGRFPGHGLEHRLGHGLLGMRERVGLYGGRLLVGPRPEGGFRVHAVLPVAAASAASATSASPAPAPAGPA
jgi:signal transduction histidine kinase